MARPAKAKGKKPWYETFFTELTGELLNSDTFQAGAATEARTIRRALGLRKGQHVLDVPCGMGRLSMPLAKMGLAVTGVDLTALYIRRARRRAQAEGLDIRFIQRDMRAIDFDGEFDAAFNWFGSFGYFTPAESLALARRIRKALKPEGCFLVEGLNKPWLAANFLRHHDEEVGRIRITHVSRFDRRTSRIHDIWTVTKGRRKERHSISMRLYDGAAISALLRQAGFREVKVYGLPRLTGRPGPLTKDSRRYFAVATR